MDRPMPEDRRTEVIAAVGCPACGADAGEACRGAERRDGSRRPRKSCHAERWRAAAEVLPTNPTTIREGRGVRGEGRERERGERSARRLAAAERLERERKDLEAIASLARFDD
jgi:hypothetical protein